MSDEGDLPIRMLHDRVLVSVDTESSERRSGGGILIPATVRLGRRLTWAKVVSIGPNVRAVKVDDRVLFFVAVTTFYVHDFSVLYVANNSNSALPTLYRFSAVWGAHEGSLLLWALSLSAWSIAVAFSARTCRTRSPPA